MALERGTQQKQTTPQESLRAGSRILQMVDYARQRVSSGDQMHPLVAASVSMQEKAGARSRTGNLVAMLLAHAARSRRRAQPGVNIRMQVLTPAGTPAVRIRVR